MTTPTAEQVRQWLGALPDLCALLPAALVARTPEQRVSRPAPGSKPPVRLDISRLLDTRETCDWESGMWRVDPDGHGVLPWLWGWCRDLEAEAYRDRAELCDEVPAEPTVSSCCTWLQQGDLLEWAADSLQQWHEFAVDTGRVVRAVRDATRAVADLQDRPVPCGRCGEPLELQRDGLWECWSGHAVSIQPVGVREAARIVEVNYETLRRWLAEDPVARIVDGARPVYDLGEIRRVVASRRLRNAVV